MGYTIGEALQVSGIKGAEVINANDLAADLLSQAMLGANRVDGIFILVDPIIARVDTEQGKVLGTVHAVSRGWEGDLRVHVRTGTSVSRLFTANDTLEVSGKLLA